MIDVDQGLRGDRPTPSPKRVATPGPNDWRTLLLALAGLLVLFSVHLYDLARFALTSDLFSHILLVPFVSAYLIWQKRSELDRGSQSIRWLAYVFFGVAAGILMMSVNSNLIPTDRLAYHTISLVLSVIGIFTFVFSPTAIRRITFPLGFLLFSAPLPQAAIDAIEHVLQHTSATAASALFSLAGQTYFRQDNFFELPGIKLLVAPECSGIHSTLALLITSLVAGQFFLNSFWRRCVLTFVVLPIAIIRNGFRIFVIGELCVRIGPEMIDSFIHHHGGPIFFSLSLIPFFLIIYLLAKSERSIAKSQ